MATSAQWIPASALLEALPLPALTDALQEAFSSQDIEAPLRHSHKLPNLSSDARFLLMPAWQADQFFGVKLVSVFPDNTGTPHPTVNGVYTLFDGQNGKPLALIDGEFLTLLRTGATSALAARYLARPDAKQLLVVGAGRLAPWMARAHCATRKFERVEIWARGPGKAEAACVVLRAEGIPACAARHLPEACRSADLITCATTARAPVLQAEWITAGTHLDLVGGFTPDMREADDALVRTAQLYADHRLAVLSEAGDLTQPIKAGIISDANLLADLADLTQHKHPGRTDAASVTLFKSVGTALADLTAATLAWKHLAHKH
jgi:ornithine cyclodeaminase